MERFRGIRNNLLGLIELNSDLDVQTVAEIFRRVNSQGVTLNTADFAMSKMAASEQYGGHLLRKCIDYFCHLAVAPEAYGDLAKDDDFASTDYFRAMEWLKKEKDDLYDPSYTDMLRVASRLRRNSGEGTWRTWSLCSQGVISRHVRLRKPLQRSPSTCSRTGSCAT